jgi:hypothetical protein
MQQARKSTAGESGPNTASAAIAVITMAKNCAGLLPFSSEIGLTGGRA